MDIFNLKNKFIARHSFANIPQEKDDYIKAKYIIFPVSYDATTTFLTGTREGALSIINSSYNLEDFDIETNQEISQLNIFTLPELAPIVSSPEDMIENIYQIYNKIIDNQRIILILGGEHTISISAIKALKERNTDFSIISFDAHTDLRDNYQGSRYSHACTLRRIYELNSHIFPIGVRSICKEELDFINNNKIKVFYAPKIKSNLKYLKELNSFSKDKVYLSIDLDVLDPSFMPAVGNPVPGGISWEDLLASLKNIIKEKEVLGVDITELSPREELKASSSLASHLVFKILMYIHKYKKGDID
jgi:agmatinase